MSNNTVEQLTTATKAHVQSLTASGGAAMSNLQELTKLCQEIFTQNAQNLTQSVQALSSVKSPAEFIALQQKLVKDNIDNAIGTGRKIAELTTAMFGGLFEPMKKQMESIQKTIIK